MKIGTFVFMSECAQSAFSRFQSAIYMHFSTVFKMQTCIINYKNRHPWMTDALRAQTKLTNVMHSRAIALNNKATFENYNRAKQQYNTIVISWKYTKLISRGLGRY